MTRFRVPKAPAETECHGLGRAVPTKGASSDQRKRGRAQDRAASNLPRKRRVPNGASTVRRQHAGGTWSDQRESRCSGTADNAVRLATSKPFVRLPEDVLLNGSGSAGTYKKRRARCARHLTVTFQEKKHRLGMQGGSITFRPASVLRSMISPPPPEAVLNAYAPKVREPRTCAPEQARFS